MRAVHAAHIMPDAINVFVLLCVLLRDAKMQVNEAPH